MVGKTRATCSTMPAGPPSQSWWSSSRGPAALALMLLAGCGGGHGTGPASPSTPTAAPASVALVTLDGITGRPVAAAGPASGLPGASLELAAPGYLVRRTFVPTDGQIFLWPLSVDEAYVRRIVYETWSFSGVQRLYRWNRTALTITPGVPDASIAAIVSTGTVTLTASSTAADIEIRIDPNHPDLVGHSGFTRCTTFGYAIDHCTVVLRDSGVLQSRVTTHELGHCLGLGHSARAEDLMNPSVRAAEPTSDERVLLTMMYGRRRPGNAPPDDDQSLGSAATTRRTLMVRD